MPFTGSFTVSQGSSIQDFTLTDNSSGGSDPNLTGRTIYLYKADGSLLGGAAIPWSISAASKLISDLLDRDYSLSIVVVWASSSPIPGASYSKTVIVTFTSYSNQFVYGKVQDLAADPDLANDANFYDNLGRLQTEIDGATQATNFSDQYNAQRCLDRAQQIMNNQNFNF